MKIAIVVLIVLLAFLGFQFYGIVTDEIQEAKVSQINTVSDAQLRTITVDNLDEITSYTHRRSTYEHTSDDLVKAASMYYVNMDLNYVHVLYYDNDNLVHEEYMDESIQLDNLHKEVLIISHHQSEIDTNLKTNDITLYTLEDATMMHIVPAQTGQYIIKFDDTVIEFENLERN